MHLAFVCNELPPASAGGIGPAVATLATGLAGLGHQVTVVGVYDRDYAWQLPGVRVLPLLGVQRHPLRWVVRRHHLRRWAIHRALRQLHAREAIDVVEWPDYEGLFVRPIPGITDVLRNHGPLMSHRLYGLASQNRVWEALELRILRTIPYWIGVSRWFMDEWLRISGAQPARTTIIYNPVDTELFHPCASPAKIDPHRVFYAGSLMERKGVFALVRAANLFLRECPQAQLWMAGRPLCDLGRLEAEIDEAVRDRVILGHPLPQARLASLMRCSAVFAMPSLLESFGNVWAEAMASGIPVVGSRRTCGPEVVPDGEAGLLVEPEHPRDVADAVVRLLRDAGLRQRMGAAGRRIAEARYARGVCVAQTVAFYQECREHQRGAQPGPGQGLLRRSQG